MGSTKAHTTMAAAAGAAIPAAGVARICSSGILGLGRARERAGQRGERKLCMARTCSNQDGVLEHIKVVEKI